MSLPVNNSALRAAIARRGFPEPEPGRVHLFGLRGAVPHGEGEVSLAENTPNAYNDTIGCFGAAFLLLLGSVDPGSDFTLQPENPRGCAHLNDGAWLYRLGSHKGHPALVQAGPVTVRRDANRDGAIEPGEPADSGFFGVDIHAGGAGPTVGAWSAGCQVIKGGWTGAPWAGFMQTVTAAKQQVYRYYLLRGSDLQ